MTQDRSVVQKGDVDKVASLYYNGHTSASYKSALRVVVGLSLEHDLQGEVLSWKDLAASTIVQRKAALSSLVRLMAQEGRVDASMLDNVIFPSGRPPVERRSATDDELDAMGKAAETTMEVAALIILADTGLRIGSLVAIRYSDLQGDSFTIRTKRNRDIEIHVTESMAAVARKLKEETGASDSDYVFSVNGKRSNEKYAYRIFKRIRDRAGLKELTPHQFRHGFATRLARSGIALSLISKLMGHKNVTTTMGYIHPDRQELKMAATKTSIGERFLK